MKKRPWVYARLLSMADVKEAHRQVPIHPRDWHLLGCRVEAGADVYINTVGTFGVASASYYWSRVSSALGRLSQYLTADSAHTWHMVVADDCHLEAGGEHYRFALFAFFLLCSTCGVSLSWNKTAGGETVRTAAQHPPPGHLTAPSRVVHEVGQRSG